MFHDPDSTPGVATSVFIPPDTFHFVPTEWTYPRDYSTFPPGRLLSPTNPPNRIPTIPLLFTDFSLAFTGPQPIPGFATSALEPPTSNYLIPIEYAYRRDDSSSSDPYDSPPTHDDPNYIPPEPRQPESDWD